MAIINDILGLFTKNPAPTKTIGSGGTAVFGGYINEAENNPKLVGRQKYLTYTDLLANTSIVAASVRYALNLTAKAGWTVEAADGSSQAQEIADWFEHELFNMTTPWHRVVRRSALYRYYGFSIQEWTAKRNDDGTIGILDVEPRPQHTIVQWGVDEGGTVKGVVQRIPQTYTDIPLTRGKLVYIVDDAINDSPEGLGLFRHVVESVTRLAEYEKLEGISFESDLRGIPIGRAPITELQKMVQQGSISPAQMDSQLQALRTFLTSHKKTANLAMLLDSKVYESKGDNKSPSGQEQWGVELLQNSSTSAPELALAISRLNREVARVLGTENLMLGDTGSGSLAMSRDKSDQFALVIDSTLKELKESYEADLIAPFMKLNGWDPDLAPSLKPEKIQHRSVEEVTSALRDMASAGAVLAPDDTAINEVRDLLGLSQVDLEQLAEDAALMAAPEEVPGTEAKQEETPEDVPDNEDEDKPRK